MLKITTGLFGIALFLCAGSCVGAEEAAPDPIVTVDMRDGTRLVGRILEEDADRIRLRTLDGMEVDVPRARVVALRRAIESEGRLQPLDPNYSRLLFSPTGRPLRKGDGYFSDYEVFFPGLSVGLTDNLTLSAGVSTIPGLGVSEQLFYVSPKIGRDFGERGAVSLGALYATERDGGDNINLGILYGIGTVGGRARSVSFGLGLADGDLGGAGDRTPIAMLGGTTTVSNHLALVAESWVALTDGFELGDQPLAFGIRFFSDRISADVGAVIIPSYLDQGGFLPWLSVSYHFGKTRGNASASPLGTRPGLSRRSPRPPSS